MVYCRRLCESSPPPHTLTQLGEEGYLLLSSPNKTMSASRRSSISGSDSASFSSGSGSTYTGGSSSSGSSSEAVSTSSPLTNPPPKPQSKKKIQTTPLSSEPKAGTEKVASHYRYFCHSDLARLRFLIFNQRTYTHFHRHKPTNTYALALTH
jgi:hypothetical protein